MNEELLALHTKVNGVIYNPFINLKDHVRAIKHLLEKTGNFEAELVKLDTALSALDQFENLPYGNIERIKGFNKVKSNILKIVKEVSAQQNNS